MVRARCHAVCTVALYVMKGSKVLDFEDKTGTWFRAAPIIRKIYDLGGLGESNDQIRAGGMTGFSDSAAA
jgi:hypothetical protein